MKQQLPTQLSAASRLEIINQGESASIELKSSLQKEVIERFGDYPSKPVAGKADQTPLHMVSAIAASMGQVLGKRATDQKSNEIVTILELLATLTLEGTIATIDAMGTQTAIARTIRRHSADYALCAKDNHPKHADSIQLALAGASGPFVPVPLVEETHGGHGPTELRRCWAYEAVRQLFKADQWADLRTVAVIERERAVDGVRTSIERHYYISSLPADASTIASQCGAQSLGHRKSAALLHQYAVQ